jgi:hypothetical protein
LSACLQAVFQSAASSGKNTILKWISFLVLFLFIFSRINFVTLCFKHSFFGLCLDKFGISVACFCKTAEHHEIHLKEYIAIENYLNRTEVKGEMQAIAFMVVTDEYMVQVRDALKPHRGELYVEEQ